MNGRMISVLLRVSLGLQLTLLSSISSGKINLAGTAVHESIPIVFRAKELTPNLSGVPINHLSLVSYIEGQLKPIPFQIDEMDKAGLVYIPHISKEKISGQLGVFDEDDELVFMASDTGSTAAPTELLSQYSVLETVNVQLPHLPQAIAYLVRDETARAPDHYIFSDLQQGMIETKSLRIQFDPKDISKIKGIQLKAASGQLSQNLLSKMEFRISTGILNKRLRVGAELGKDITAKPLAIHTGPVRNTVLLEGRLLFMGMPIYRDRLSMNFYRHSVNMPARFTKTGVRSVGLLMSLIRQPRFELDLTFNHLQGSTLGIDSYLYNDQVHFARVDGMMSGAEYAFNQETLPGDFIWVNSHQGWQCVFTNTLPVVPGGLFDGFLEGMNIEVDYEDLAYQQGSISVTISVEGLPKAAMGLLKEMGRLDFEKIKNLNDLLNAMIELDEKGKLRKLDKINQKVIEQKIQAGQIKEPKDYIESFLADFNRIAIKGIDRTSLNTAIYRAVASFDTLESLSEMRIGTVISNFQQEATKMELDLSSVMKANIDNTFWLPIDSSPVNPEIFYKIANTTLTPK